MKTKDSSSWICHIQNEDAVLSPKNCFIDHVAVLDQHILGCGGGKLYQRTRGTWESGCQGDCIFKMAELKQNVCVHGNKAVLLTGNENSTGELFIFDSETKSQERVPLKFGSKSSTVLSGTKDGRDFFYITNHDEKVVHHLDENGELIRSLGSELFCYPYSMALDLSGDVIVSDWLLNDVIIFAPDGSVKRRLGKNNNFSAENTFYPYGVASDEEGFIFVSSWRESKIILFSPCGDLIKTLLTGLDGLDGPTNLTTKNGHLIVVNCHGTQICCYRYKISGPKETKEITHQKLMVEA